MEYPYGKDLTMRKITISRPQKGVLPFSKGKIMIDNVENEIIKAGKTAVVEVPDGHHDLQIVFAALPPVNSNVVYIEETDGDIDFEVKITVPLSNQTYTYAELTRK